MSSWLGTLRALALLALLGTIATPPARAQSAPKPGPEYEDSANIGFKIKMPEGWDFVPPEPGEQNEIGRYSAGRAGYIVDPKKNSLVMTCDVQMLKFDRRAKPDEASDADGERKFRPQAIQDFTAWASKIRGSWKAEPKKELTVNNNKVKAVRHSYAATEDGIPVRMLAYEYKLKPDLDVAVVFFGPGEDKKWNKFENAYDAMGKSFKLLELEEVAGATPTGNSMRDQKRAQLLKEVASQPGWALYETPNYFIISAKNDDKPFIEELKHRLEAIRKVYEELYPASVAAQWRQNAKVKPAPEANAPEDGPKVEGLTESAKPVDPMELSRCSIVRICKDREGYMSYGGSSSSAGYWNSYRQELVVYDDQAGGGRDDTWITLNHEAFHQYVFYFFGQLSPHSWFNEGTGDFFSGYQLERKKFVLKENSWRQREIQGAIRAGTYVPLKEIVRFTQPQYYSTNDKYNSNPFIHYAEGWAFIYFLRTAKKNAKCWNPAWESILDTYLRTLVETDDLDESVDKAFLGVDWDELERCWKEYILAG